MGLKDLDGFDRIWLIYWFHRAAEPKLVTPTYLDDDPHGVFATRLPARPNPIGMSAVRLAAVQGNLLQVEDIDVIDGTPLIDIKPYSPHLDHFEVKRSGWLDPIWTKKEMKISASNGSFER